MARKKSPQQLEWYKLLLVLIGAFGIVLALVHWYVSGVDIPNGLLTLLTLIVSATLGPNAVSSIADTLKNSSKDTDIVVGEESYGTIDIDTDTEEEEDVSKC